MTRKISVLAVAFVCAWGWVCNVSVVGQETNESTDSSAQKTQGVKVSNFDTVQLNVRGADLESVLQLLSVQSRRNIVPSPNVHGKVTANLYDVTFYEALDAILQQNGAGYVEKGNFIYVYTLDELSKIQQVERKVSFKVFKLNYLTAADASTFITPLLSGAGSVAMTANASAGFQPTLSEAGADSFAHSHTIVVKDYPDVLEEVAKVIKELDVAPKQVLVEATVLKAELTENMEFGVDFSILANLDFDELTNPFSAVTELADGSLNQKSATAVHSTVGNVKDGDGGLKLGIMSGDVAIFMRALDSVTDTTVIANPKVLVLNRQRAEVLVGKKFGYLSTQSNSTSTTQTVEFAESGTKLTVRPFVSEDGQIRMELRPSISSIEVRDLTSGNTVATIPDETTQELISNVMVRDGQTIVLGGLFEEEISADRNQVPGLGDVPVVGNAFKGREDKLERTEVIFLITPHIVKEHALAEAGRAAADTVEMMRFGAREGLLPWTRSNMTAAHMRDALRYLDSEQPEKALWEVEMALSLNPRFVEARRLKERLTGQRQYWPNGSVLDEMVDVMVEQQLGAEPNYRERPLEPSPRPAHPMPLDNPMPRAVGEAEPEQPVEASASADSTDPEASPAQAQVETESADSQPSQQVSQAAGQNDLQDEQAAVAESTQPQTEAALPKTLAEIDAEIQAQRGDDSDTSVEDSPAGQTTDDPSENLAEAQWGQADPLPEADDQAAESTDPSTGFEAEAEAQVDQYSDTDEFQDEWSDAQADDQQWSEWDQFEEQANPSEQFAEVDSAPAAEARSTDERLFQGTDEQAEEPTVSDGALPRVLIEALRELEQNQSGAPADATADVPTDEVN